MKISDVKHAIVQIFSDRNVQLTLACFFIGLFLALSANYPVLEERVEKDTLEEGDDTRIEVRLSSPYGDPSEATREDEMPLQQQGGLKNATLELHSEDGNTNATVRLIRDGLRIKSWNIENWENKTINMTEYHKADYIEFQIREGELSYNYTTKHYTLSYWFLSIPAAILMVISVIFFLRAIALMGPLTVDEGGRNKLREDQEVINSMIEDRKENTKQKNDKKD